MLTNATLRRKLGMNPKYADDGTVKRAIKSVFGRVLKKTGVGVKSDDIDYVTFKVVTGGTDIEDVEPYVRDF